MGNGAHAPEEAARRARDTALEHIRSRGLLSEFVEEVATACTNFDPSAQGPSEPAPRSLLFDLPGRFELLGPDEVDGLLAELVSSDAPISALEALSADPHLLEDLCFGPAWPQLCAALGRLAGLAQLQQEAQQQLALAPQKGPPPPPPALSRLSELVLGVLGEAVSAVASSSPAHAADLLAELAPRLCGGGGGGGGAPAAAALRLQLPAGPGGGAAAPATAQGLLAAAVAADPFVTALAQLAHSLLSGLAAEFHTLPPGAAERAAAAVVELVRAGVDAVGGGGSGSGGNGGGSGGGGSGGSRQRAEQGAWLGQSGPPAASPATVVAVGLSALDLLVLMDPELRWWQRLCSATHATQQMADAARATRLAEALEAAWERLAVAAPSLGFSHAAGDGDGGGGGGGGKGGGGGGGGDVEGGGVGSSPTQPVACTALLAGLVRSNNPGLLACEAPPGSVGGAGGCGSVVGLYAEAAAAQMLPAPQREEARCRCRRRLQRMLGHLNTCFCSTLKTRAPRRDQPGDGSGGDGGGSGGDGGGGATIFMHLAAEVLVSAAAQGHLADDDGGDNDAAGGAGAADGAGGRGVLASLLNALLFSDATVSMPASPWSADTARAWQAAASRVLDTAAAAWQAHTAAAAAAAGSSGNRTGVVLGPPPEAAAKYAATVLTVLLGYVRAAVLVEMPPWAHSAVRCATRLAAAGSPTAAAALEEFHGELAKCLRLYGGAHAQRSYGGAAASAAFAAAPAAAAAAAPGTAAPDPRQLSGLQQLAAEAVLLYCDAAATAGGSDTVANGAVAMAAPSGTKGAHAEQVAAAAVSLPIALRRRVILDCAARHLCLLYDGVGAITGDHNGGVGAAARGFGGEACMRVAAKRRVAKAAGALAASCSIARAALLSAGFVRRILDDVTAVLRSGEYESPYMEPLPYADPLAGLTCVLAGVLSWPGFLQLLHPPPPAPVATAAAPPLRSRPGQAADPAHRHGGGGGKAGGAREGGSGIKVGDEAETDQEDAGGAERSEAVAVVEELVSWLDPDLCRSRGLPHTDAAATSLAVLLAALRTDPRVATASLGAHTSARRYLTQMLTWDTPASKEADDQDCEGAAPASGVTAAAAAAPCEAAVPRGGVAGTRHKEGWAAARETSAPAPAPALQDREGESEWEWEWQGTGHRAAGGTARRDVDAKAGEGGEAHSDLLLGRARDLLRALDGRAG